MKFQAADYDIIISFALFSIDIHEHVIALNPTDLISIVFPVRSVPEAFQAIHVVFRAGLAIDDDTSQGAIGEKGLEPDAAADQFVDQVVLRVVGDVNPPHMACSEPPRRLERSSGMIVMDFHQVVVLLRDVSEMLCIRRKNNRANDFLESLPGLVPDEHRYISAFPQRGIGQLASRREYRV